MLKIRRLKRYRTAKYPKGKYASYKRGQVEDLVKRGGMSLVLLSLVEALGCDSGTGVTGPPPVRPDMVTENEARQIITQVFTNNGIVLNEDYPLILRSSTNDSMLVNVDGFNDSLQVGYEYRSEKDDISPEACRALADSAEANGPYVKILDGIVPQYQELLEDQVEAFIDTLRAHGII